MPFWLERSTYHHRDRVRQLVAYALERRLPDQFRDEGLLGLVGQLAVRVERRALREAGDEQVGEQVHLEPVDGRAGHDVRELHELGHLREPLGDLLGLGLVGLRDDPEHRRAPGHRAQLVRDELVAPAHRLVGRHAEPDDVDLGPRLADDVVEPAAEQRAWLVQAGRVDDDELRGGPVQDSADRVPRGLRAARRDRDLLPDQRVGQRRLAGVGPPDEAGEPGPEPLGDLREAEPGHDETRAPVTPPPAGPASRR
jgi:hypothetical protein